VSANYGVAGALDWNVNLSHYPGYPPTPTPTFNNGGGVIAMGNAVNTAFYNNGTTLAGSLTVPIGNYGYWGGSTPSWVGGTFDFTPVPEAATFGAAAVGLFGLVYIVRYVRIRRTPKAA
jgi:hypothetical protein